MSVYEDLERAQTGVRELRTALAATGADFIAATRERDEARTEVERLNRAITRVLVLIAPETQMAQPLYGERYFQEADIRTALAEPTS